MTRYASTRVPCAEVDSVAMQDITTAPKVLSNMLTLARPRSPKRLTLECEREICLYLHSHHGVDVTAFECVAVAESKMTSVTGTYPAT